MNSRFIPAAVLVITGLSTGHAMAACELEFESSGASVGPVQVEVADDVVARSQGLMYRRELPAGTGLLLRYHFAGEAAVWMRNTFIPLDIIFMDKEGTISRIVPHARPQSEQIHRGVGSDRIILELNAGEAQSLGLSVGDRAVLSALNPGCMSNGTGSE